MPWIRSKQRGFGNVKALAAVLVAIGGFAPVHQSAVGRQMLHTPGARVWMVEVSFDRTGSGSKRTDDSTPQRKIINTTRKTASEKITIKACGELPGDLYVTDEKRTLSDRTEKESVDEYVEASCWPEDAKNHTQLYVRSKMKPEIKRPGNSSNFMEQSILSPYEGPGLPRLEKWVQAALVFGMKGTWTLIVRYEGYISTLKDSVGRTTFACTGGKTVNESHFRTSQYGAKPNVNSKSSGSGDNRQTTLDMSMPPTQLPRILIESVRLDGNAAAGSKIISEEKPTPANGNYAETLTASWKITSKDNCDDAYQALLNELAFAEAYADKTIRDVAGSIKLYEAMTCLRAYEIFHKHMPPPGEMPCVDTASVDPATGKASDIGVSREEELRKKCAPDVILDAEQAHEKAHLEQRKKYGAAQFSSSDIPFRGRMDQEAYSASAQVYLDWLKKNCPDKDVSKEAKRLWDVKPLGTVKH